jgi:DNA-binding PadR family transcriptional regulator
MSRPVFAHGRLRLYLLKLLDEAPRHGYEVIRLLEERFHGLYAPSAGTVYPRLAKLEQEGLVEHSVEGGRKVYRITTAGHAELEARAAELAELEAEIHDSVSQLADQIREDVRDSAQDLRDEMRRAAKESRRQVRFGEDTWRTDRESWQRAKEEWRQAKEQAKEQTREAKEQARYAKEEAREAKEQARAVREQACPRGSPSSPRPSAALRTRPVGRSPPVRRRTCHRPRPATAPPRTPRRRTFRRGRGSTHRASPCVNSPACWIGSATRSGTAPATPASRRRPSRTPARSWPTRRRVSAAGTDAHRH